MDLAPRLRHRIDIQQVSEAGGVRGNIVETWVSVRTTDEPDLIPAEISAIGAREFIAAAAQQVGATTRITIRYRQPWPDGRTMRVLHEGVAYNIKGTLPDNTRRTWMHLLCENGVRLAG